MTRKGTQVNLENPSIITRAYIFPYKLHALVGPNKSTCNSFKGLEDVICLDLKELLFAYPIYKHHRLIFFKLHFG